MKRISDIKMNQLIDMWSNDKNAAQHGEFYCYNGAVWVGCDNSTGDCWVEEFGCEADVIKWLNGESVRDAGRRLLNDNNL